MDNKKLVGALLKAKRFEQEKSQRDIAKQVGFPNPTFLSAIESGTCKIPIKKFHLLLKAYGLSKSFEMEILKLMHPDIFDLLKYFVRDRRVKNKIPVSLRSDRRTNIESYLKLAEIGA